MQLFETPRLTVRKLSLHDVPALTEILSDPEVMKFSVRGVCDEEATRNFVEWNLKCYSTRWIGSLALMDKGSGELAGFCGVGPELVSGIEEASLGYRLAKRFWNRGFASEAANGTLDYVFAKKVS